VRKRDEREKQSDWWERERECVRRSERKIGRVGEGVGEVAIEKYRGLDMSKCSV
jgi:hypothetical protein